MPSDDRLPLIPPVIAGAALFLAGAAPPAFAQGPAPALRELTTDRPDTTESPFTIDAGHVQIETGLIDWARGPRGPDGTRGDAFGFGETNVRIGLTARLEADIVVQPYGVARDSRRAPRRGGIGALTLRAKYNFFGNDGGRTALAILPFVAIPLDRSSPVGPAATEYGVLVPLAIELNDRFSLGLNAGLNLRRPERGRDLRASLPLTASLGVAASETVGAYYELAAEFGSEDILALNTGLTWRVRPNVQLDTGIGFGLTAASDQLVPFVGFSIRF